MTFHIVQSPYNQRGLKDSHNVFACNKHVEEGEECGNVIIALSCYEEAQ